MFDLSPNRCALHVRLRAAIPARYSDNRNVTVQPAHVERAGLNATMLEAARLR